MANQIREMCLLIRRVLNLDQSMREIVESLSTPRE